MANFKFPMLLFLSVQDSTSEGIPAVSGHLSSGRAKLVTTPRSETSAPITTAGRFKRDFQELNSLTVGNLIVFLVPQTNQFVNL